jgi:Glycosyl transferases group 1
MTSTLSVKPVVIYAVQSNTRIGMRKRQSKIFDWRSWIACAADFGWRVAAPCAQPALSHTNPELSVIVTWPSKYQHPNAAPFVESLLAGLATMGRVHRAYIPQPYEGIVLLTVDAGYGPQRVAIDYFDFTHVNEQCVREVDVYFKMQYRRQGYGANFSHVIPGGYVASSMYVYRYWCYLRRLHRQGKPIADVFGRFGLRYATEVRARAIEILTSDPRVAFAGGTSSRKYTWYLREMARARVCLDLPGQGPFCYRLVEALAMGSCVVGPPHETALPVRLRPGVEIVHCAPDLSDLADLCAYYVHNAAACASVGRAAAQYFDEHLHPLALAAYYVESVRTASR